MQDAIKRLGDDKAQLATTQRTDLADSLQDALLPRVAENASSLMEKLKSIAARAWDGIRRVWGWLKHVLQHGGEVVETELWNIARMIALSAKKAYEVVSKAIDILRHAAACWGGRVYPGNDSRTAVFQFAMDFDTALFVNSAADPAEMTSQLDREKQDTAYFVEACRIWAVILGALRHVGQVVVTGVTAPGWFVLLITLAREAGRLRDFGREIADWCPTGSMALRR